jgi:hypothetical protein
MAFKFELHAALSLVGFQNNNRPFPVREGTFEYSIDFCQRLCQLVQLTVKVTSLVLILAVINHVNPNYGR